MPPSASFPLLPSSDPPPTPVRPTAAGAVVWSLAVTSAIADPHCDCWGQGMRPALDGETVPCDCVFRAVYQSVAARFLEGQAQSIVQIRRTVRRTGNTWSRDNEDFLADVHLCARRSLPPALLRSFRAYADGRLDDLPVAELATIELLLGRAFAENALWPLDRYFGTTPRPKRTRRRRHSRHRHSHTTSSPTV